MSEQEIKEYCESNGNMPYFEVSAKESRNISQAFEEIARLGLMTESFYNEEYI